MGKITEWLREFRPGGNLPKKNHLLLILLAGILLLAVTFPDSSSDGSASGSEENGISGSDNHSDMQKYTDDLENQVEEILRQVEGVGEVRVMITLKSGNRKIIEKDGRTNGDNTEEESSIYRQNADGSSEPYVNTELSPGIEGVAVIAQGAGNAVIRQEITEAVQALFDVDAHKIKIMKHA